MVVLVVEQDYILILEPEREPPIAIHSNGPMVFEFAAQRISFARES